MVMAAMTREASVRVSMSRMFITPIPGNESRRSMLEECGAAGSPVCRQALPRPPTTRIGACPLPIQSRRRHWPSTVRGLRGRRTPIPTTKSNVVRFGSAGRSASSGSCLQDTSCDGCGPARDHSVSCSLNLKAAAGVLVGVGAPKARSAAMADSRLAQAATGYVLGGISPVGTKRALPTALDTSAMDLSTMLVSGGRRGFDIELAPEDLKNLLRAAVGDLTR